MTTENENIPKLLQNIAEAKDKQERESLERTNLDYGFYHGDCMEYLPDFPDNYFDLAIVDPPYGINYDAAVQKNAGNRSKNGAAQKKNYHTSNWDTDIPPKEYFEELFRVSKHQIIWGGTILRHIYHHLKGLYVGIKD